MINNLTFGKYIHKTSLLHKLDPRIKIITFIFLLAMIFINVGIIGYIILVGIALVVIIASRLPLSIFWSASLPIFIMVIFITLFNMFLTRDGSVLFYIGNYSIHQRSFERSLQMFLRIILMVQFTTILTASTRPIDIAVAISALLRPLKIIKVPVNEIGIMISITLRFIPTLLDEASIIVNAQSARGVDFKRGELIEKAKAILSLIIPLFVSALGKAEDLSNAMEARGYNPKGKRSKYRKLKVKYYDIIVFSLIFGLLIFFILLSVWKGLEVVRYLDRYFELW